MDNNDPNGGNNNANNPLQQALDAYRNDPTTMNLLNVVRAHLSPLHGAQLRAAVSLIYTRVITAEFNRATDEGAPPRARRDDQAANADAAAGAPPPAGAPQGPRQPRRNAGSPVVEIDPNAHNLDQEDEGVVMDHDNENHEENDSEEDAEDEDEDDEASQGEPRQRGAGSRSRRRDSVMGRRTNNSRRQTGTRAQPSRNRPAGSGAVVQDDNAADQSDQPTATPQPANTRSNLDSAGGDNAASAQEAVTVPSQQNVSLEQSKAGRGGARVGKPLNDAYVQDLFEMYTRPGVLLRTNPTSNIAETVRAVLLALMQHRVPQLQAKHAMEVVRMLCSPETMQRIRNFVQNYTINSAALQALRDSREGNAENRSIARGLFGAPFPEFEQLFAAAAEAAHVSNQTADTRLVDMLLRMNEARAYAQVVHAVTVGPRHKELRALLNQAAARYNGSTVVSKRSYTDAITYLLCMSFNRQQQISGYAFRTLKGNLWQRIRHGNHLQYLFQHLSMGAWLAIQDAPWLSTFTNLTPTTTNYVLTAMLEANPQLRAGFESLNRLVVEPVLAGRPIAGRLLLQDTHDTMLFQNANGTSIQDLFNHTTATSEAAQLVDPTEYYGFENNMPLGDSFPEMLGFAGEAAPGSLRPAGAEAFLLDDDSSDDDEADAMVMDDSAALGAPVSNAASINLVTGNSGVAHGVEDGRGGSGNVMMDGSAEQGVDVGVGGGDDVAMDGNATQGADGGSQGGGDRMDIVASSGASGAPGPTQAGAGGGDGWNAPY